MKRSSLFIVVIAGCIGWAACYKDVTVDLPVLEPRLVVQAYTATGDSFRVAVNRTVSGSGQVPLNDTYIENALAVLYENNLVVDTLLYDRQRKRYVSRLAVAATGRTYTLVVSAAGYSTVEATAKAPELVEAVDIVHTPFTRTTISGNRLDDVSFSFRDPGEKNYYLSALYPSQRAPFTMCVYTYDAVIEQIRTEPLPFDESDCLDSEEVLFTDKAFNGTRKTLVLSGDHQDLITWTEPGGTVMRPHLKLYSLSGEYYNYLKQSISAANGPDEFLSFTNPATPKGNVKNGLGIFTVYAVSVHPIM